ncbi:MAG: glycerophosphodiester phosphodiesterase [Candidatus Hermodarchaeota archaeon]
MISEFLFIGHRGTRINFDENTISAFIKAIECGANYVEFDVRKTKDGNLVLLHDSTLDRTTNGSGLLQNFTFKEIKDFKTKLQQSEIPLLTKVFDVLKGRTRFMIELKETKMINRLVKLIKNYDLVEQCIISGRILTEILKFKKILPKSKICYNITKGQGLSLTEFMNLSNYKKTKLNIDLISLHSSLISNEFIELCHKNEIMSLSWDFLNYKNPLQKIKSLIALDVDGLLFDNYKNIQEIKKLKNPI